MTKHIPIHYKFKMVFNMKSKLGMVATLLTSSFSAALMMGCLANEESSRETPKKHLLFVAHLGSLMAYDIETGAQQVGQINDVADPNDMQALENGVLLVNLTNQNAVLVANGKDMTQIKRIPSTLPGKTAVRPVHSFITPRYNGKQYWISFNDGKTTGNSAELNSALFIDISTPSDTASIKAVGELGLGIGHHMASFSKTQHRAVIHNFSDTTKVLGVYDYSNPAQVTEVKAWSPAELGLRKPVQPHGCATAKLNGQAYCNAAGSGSIISVNIDAAAPTARILKTKGVGGTNNMAHPDGRYVYFTQTSPREGDTTRPGEVCQIGQIAVIDAQTDTVVKEVAIKYDGPDCTRSLVGTEAFTASPGSISISGNKLYVQVSTSRSDSTGSTSKHLVLDITNPANPVQTASLNIGKSAKLHGITLSGDKKFLFVANNVDGTVTQINGATGTVVKTLTVGANPSVLATWGELEGPSLPMGPLE